MDLGASFAREGILSTLLLIFLSGLALNLTPCVYPMIPITVSIFVNQDRSSPRRGFLLAASYVLGMCLTYSAVGVAAALVGGVLGQALQNPYVIVGIASVFVAMGLSMLGLFEIRAPDFLTGGGARTGYPGAMFMGMVVGFVAAPCIGPFVLSLILYVAQLQDPVRGFLFFFILSLGLGSPYLVLGASTAALHNLPRAGGWMLSVKRFFGAVMLLMALYYLKPVAPLPILSLLAAMILYVTGVGAGGLEPLPREGEVPDHTFRVVSKAVGVASLVLASMLVWQILFQEPAAAHGAAGSAGRIAWTDDPGAIDRARQEGKPVMIDFFSDIWCPACKELEAITYSDPAVIAETRRFVNLKIDLDRHPRKPEMVERFKVKGAPTIVFLDTKGRERPDLRVVGFAPPDRFLPVMKRVP